ncbi:hypothetical protein K1T71_005459 [Dendrolimus kikuchii]|uniref:Uncharacterized protein n=1 Tax=Dendrolimus kikuchii TaxID=765133 RepID=A0ACC1D430_9NEOP|nr:hypothetical protein K1T71_005459 [Dendrolimus kikuchii]
MASLFLSGVVLGTRAKWALVILREKACISQLSMLTKIGDKCIAITSHSGNTALKVSANVRDSSHTNASPTCSSSSIVVTFSNIFISP